jgi:multimeric flavodoxin WrbA
MKDIYKLLEQSNIIIFGSPTYFFNVSSRMKTFMERCNPYWFNKKLKGKKAIILGVGGSPGKSIEEMI